MKPKLKPILLLSITIVLMSCTTKKDVLYFQDAQTYPRTPITYANNTIQPNDILDIKIGALVPETALPYNRQTNLTGNMPVQNINLLRLQGYLVDNDGYVVLPILGRLLVAQKPINVVEKELEIRLEKGQHLVKPTVSIRLLNAKVSILGEVNSPGTYTFTEQFISVPQALGYAGDLTINGKRSDIVLIREADGNRTITHLDLTTTDWMSNPQYRIMPNDVIVVNPNNAKIKSAGLVGSAATVVSIVSVLLSITILLSR